MRWPVYLIGFILLALGGGIVINPEITRKMIDYIDGIKARLYSVGVLRVVMGVLLLFSAANTRRCGFVVTLGAVLILDGIAIFAVPYNSIIKLVAWYRERSSLTYRIIGIVLVILASILIFAC